MQSAFCVGKVPYSKLPLANGYLCSKNACLYKQGLETRPKLVCFVKKSRKASTTPIPQQEIEEQHQSCNRETVSTRTHCSQEICQNTSANRERDGLSISELAGPWPALTVFSVAGSALLGVGGLLGTGFDASGPGSVASALGILAAIVTVHECGHFIAARSQNIHVTKFSIGFGPALWKYQGEKVEFSVRAIPLGGFVGFPDDDPESEFKPDDPDLLRNRPIAGRLLVMSAGIIANCIFAFSILFAQASSVGMAEATILPGVRIPKVVAGSAADVAGLKKGDIVVAVGDRPISNSKENVNRLVQYIKDHPERRLVFKVARKDGIQEVPITTDLDADGDGKIGAQLATYAKITRRVAAGPVDAAGKAAKEFVRMFGLVGKGLLQLVTNFSQTKQAVSGPLAIVAAGAEVARNDAASLLQYAAVVNINLALVNALPLPALDGAYILLLLVEAVRGKKLDKIVEQTFMASGFLLLTGVGLFLLIRDALNLSQNLL